MSVSSIGASIAQQLLQTGKSGSKPSAQVAKPTDADGDKDGDTSASESKGLDVKG